MRKWRDDRGPKGDPCRQASVGRGRRAAAAVGRLGYSGGGREGRGCGESLTPKGEREEAKMGFNMTWHLAAN